MNGKCEKCGDVYSITYSPNKIQGYFVTEEVWEVRESSLLDEVIKEEGNKPICCRKCPKCGHISREDEF